MLWVYLLHVESNLWSSQVSIGKPQLVQICHRLFSCVGLQWGQFLPCGVKNKTKSRQSQECTGTMTEECVFENQLPNEAEGWMSSPGLCSSAIVRAQALPNTTKSRRELAPSRFAPWTLAHAASPQAYRPGTTLSAPLVWVMTWWEKSRTMSEGSHWRSGGRTCGGVTYLSFIVCGYSSHIVMNSRQDGDGLLGNVDTSKNHGSLWDARKPGGQLLGREVVQLKVHVVLFGTNTPESAKTSLGKKKEKKKKTAKAIHTCTPTCPL